jgi:hypothetical protein
VCLFPSRCIAQLYRFLPQAVVESILEFLLFLCVSVFFVVHVEVFSSETFFISSFQRWNGLFMKLR